MFALFEDVLASSLGPQASLPKILLCICESSRKKERKKRKINRINNERETGERAKRIKKNNKKLVLIIIIAYFCTRIKNKS